jgi:hypothetical protein
MSTESNSQTGALTAPKITASVTLQQWGGYKNDQAIDIETVEFDAAPVLAAMSPEDRAALEDSEADDIFYSAVHLGLVADHAGPFNVHIREALDRALEENSHLFEEFTGFPVLRTPGAILDAPLSAYEIGARADDDGVVSGLAVMGLDDLMGNDLEANNDAIGEALVGSCLLMEPTIEPLSVKNGQLVVKLEGDASAVIDGFDGEELVQYNAGRAIRAAEGA